MVKNKKESKKAKVKNLLTPLTEEQGVSLLEIVEKQAPITVDENFQKKFEEKKEEMKKKYNVVE